MSSSTKTAFVPLFSAISTHRKFNSFVSTNITSYKYRAFPQHRAHRTFSAPDFIRTETERSEISSSIPDNPLSPPNDEVDWVIVDVLAQETDGDQLPAYAGEAFLNDVQDDAKSLVRVLLRDASAEISIMLCTNKYIQCLNKQWRDKDTVTDVLSFPQNDPDQVVLGDIVISVETAFEQSKQRSIDLRDEMRILLVHGTLHLLGYDHEGKKPGDWLVMAQMENRLMKQLSWKGEGLVSEVQDPFYRDIVQP